MLIFCNFPTYVRLCPTTPIHAAHTPFTQNVRGAYRFGLFPFRSPLLREYTIVFFSSGYWDVSLPQVRSLHRRVHSLKTVWVSSFGDFRIKGCYTPPRNFSQLRHVLHRLLQPRHPPYALGFYWEPKKPFCPTLAKVSNVTATLIYEHSLRTLTSVLCDHQNIFTDEKTSFRMDLKVKHLGVLLDDHTFWFLILLLKRQ